MSSDLFSYHGELSFSMGQFEGETSPFLTIELCAKRNEVIEISEVRFLTCRSPSLILNFGIDPAIKPEN